MIDNQRLNDDLLVDDSVASKDVQETGDLVQQKNSTQFKGKFSGVADHRHDGEDLPSIKLQDIINFFPSTSSAPVDPPKRFADQVRMYSNAGIYRLYIYDIVDKAWRYVALT